MGWKALLGLTLFLGGVLLSEFAKTVTGAFK